ncbi:MAG: carboxypeptidase-like regulatory domain-containing protein [Pyrinomonadaceae bacterium]
MNKKTQEWTNESGAALATVMFVSVLLLTASAFLLSAVGNNSRNSTDVLYEAKAYYAAESGLQATINVLRHRNVEYSRAVLNRRVVDYNGRGISGATLLLVNFNNGEKKTVITNTFGYYSFKDLAVMDIYNLDVAHRRYKFTESVRTFSLEGDLTDMNFSAAR